MTQPLTPDEWESRYNEAQATRAERVAYLTKAMPRQHKSDELPWTHVEELVARHSAPAIGWLGRSMTRKVAAFGAVLAFILPIIRASSPLTVPGLAKSDKCHL